MTARAQVIGVISLTLSWLASGCGDDTIPLGGSAPVGGGGGESSSGGSPTGGEGGEGGAPVYHPGEGESCNALLQDCADPEAPKCVLDFDDSMNLPATCAELLGEALKGEACVRPDDVAGEDTCAPGLYCNYLNNPLSNPQERSCSVLCDDASDCEADEWCFRLNHSEEMEPFEADTRLIGYCAYNCTSVFDDTCPLKTRCLSGTAIDAVPGFSCFPGSADKGLGESCAGNNDCEAPLGCNLSTNVCAPFCDPTHPCAVNSTCSSSGTGICVGPPPGWTCSDAAFADGEMCDCNCGTLDPDCADQLLPQQGCTGTDVCNVGFCVPPEWTCPGAYFDVDDGCDCGCGIVDPDCADTTVASCQYCGDAGACNTGSCPGTIDPLDNSTCQ